MNIFKTFLTRRPPDMMKSDSPLYLAVDKSPKTEVWYKRQPLGVHSLGQFMKTMADAVKPGSHIPQTYLRRSCRLQLTTLCYLSQWAPGASAMDRRRTQFCSKCKSNCAIFNHFTSKYGSNRLTGIRCDHR